MIFLKFSLGFFLVTYLIVCSVGKPQNSTEIIKKQHEILPGSEKEFRDDEPVSIWHLYNQYDWLERSRNLENENCKSDIGTYLNSLKKGKSWAFKMFDASGHYTSPYYFGNIFWLGSLSLCDDLHDKENKQQVPPFATHFFIANIKITNISDSQADTDILLGECLPKSCKVPDVKYLLDEETYHGGTLTIVNVRRIPGEYSILTDQKFYIVGGCSLLILLVVMLASIVDITRKGHLCSADLEVNKNDAKAQQNIKTKLNVYLRLLLAFSAVKNGKKILSVERLSDDTISCLHGLRFMSIAWIIMVHTFLGVFGIGRNRGLRRLTERNFMFQTISNATFSVDTFFFISGLLITLVFFRNNAKKGKLSKQLFSVKTLFFDVLRLFSMVIYRFLRLTPVYFLVLNVNEIIMKNIHSPAIFDHLTCKKFWWRNILYINNFFPQKEFCMLWSWYLANDSQFHIIASIFLIIAIKNSRSLKLVSISVGFLLISSWITTFVIAMKHEYVATVKQPFGLFDELYDKPWMRIGPYLIGMASGYTLYKNNCKIKIHPLLVTMGWTLSLSCLASLVYGLGQNGLVIPASAFYVALGHTAWGLSIAWITIACSSGYGGILNSFFSWKLFNPLSRLTYCAYLVHPMMMCFTNFALDGPIEIHHFFTVVIFFGNLTISFLVAFVISMGFEAPMVNILKIVF